MDGVFVHTNAALHVAPAGHFLRCCTYVQQHCLPHHPLPWDEPRKHATLQKTELSVCVPVFKPSGVLIRSCLQALICRTGCQRCGSLVQAEIPA